MLTGLSAREYLQERKQENNPKSAQQTGSRVSGDEELARSTPPYTRASEPREERPAQRWDAERSEQAEASHSRLSNAQTALRTVGETTVRSPC